MKISAAKDQPEEIRKLALRTRVECNGEIVDCIQSIDAERGEIERVESYKVCEPGSGLFAGLQLRKGRCKILGERAECDLTIIEVGDIEWGSVATATGEVPA